MVVTNQDVEQTKAQPCPPPKYPKEDARAMHRIIPGFSNRVQTFLVSEHVGQLFLQKQNFALSSFNEWVIQEMGDRRPLFKIFNKTPVCKKSTDNSKIKHSTFFFSGIQERGSLVVHFIVNPK